MPTAYLNRRWISKFLVEKFVLWKSALIHSILHQTGTITSGFEGKKRKYHFLKNRAILWYALSRAVHKNRTSQVRFSPSKPDLSGPKKFFESVISYQQDTNWTLKTEWLSAWDTRRRPHKGEPENAAERGGRNTMQRERHPKFEITLIRKTRTNSSDFALKFTSYFLKTGTTSS